MNMVIKAHVVNHTLRCSPALLEDSRAKDDNGAGDIWGTTVRNKRVPISGFMGIFASEDRDEELKAVWKSMVFREYRMGDCHKEVMRPT